MSRKKKEEDFEFSWKMMFYGLVILIFRDDFYKFVEERTGKKTPKKFIKKKYTKIF